MNRSILNIVLLFITALIWGIAFVAQSVSMDFVGPLTFICLRFLIGGVVLLPVIWFFDRSKKKKAGVSVSENKTSAVQPKRALLRDNRQLLTGGILCGLCLFAASLLQQIGIQYTTVGKAGFITAFYIIIVPILGIFLKRYCGVLTWVAVGVALVGLYFLCMNEALRIQPGDLLILLSAFMFAAQIMVVDHYIIIVDAVKMSCIQFFTAGVLGLIGMLLFESPHFSMILQGALPILYTGILSTGVGYTLQIVGQKGLNPTMAALILSLESVFSALSGFVILHQVLAGREILGCVFMFTAIVLAQMPSPRRKKVE